MAKALTNRWGMCVKVYTATGHRRVWHCHGTLIIWHIFKAVMVVYDSQIYIYICNCNLAEIKKKYLGKHAKNTNCTRTNECWFWVFLNKIKWSHRFYLPFLLTFSPSQKRCTLYVIWPPCLYLQIILRPNMLNSNSNWSFVFEVFRKVWHSRWHSGGHHISNESIWPNSRWKTFTVVCCLC